VISSAGGSFEMDGCTVHVDLGGSATAEDYTALIRLMHFEFGVDLITPAKERPMQFSPLVSAIPPLGLRDMIIKRIKDTSIATDPFVEFFAVE
jgi:hypothetical protein